MGTSTISMASMSRFNSFLMLFVCLPEGKHSDKNHGEIRVKALAKSPRGVGVHPPFCARGWGNGGYIL